MLRKAHHSEGLGRGHILQKKSYFDGILHYLKYCIKEIWKHMGAPGDDAMYPPCCTLYTPSLGGLYGCQSKTHLGEECIIRWLSYRCQSMLFVYPECRKNRIGRLLQDQY